jgi:hypothetical protein
MKERAHSFVPFSPAAANACGELGMILSNSSDAVTWATGLVSSLVTLVGALTLLVVALTKFNKKLQALQASLQRTNLAVFEVARNPGTKGATDAAEALPKPDPAKVGEWARQHRARNAWDMGPKNWERCLYDLGYPGGKYHPIRHGNNGDLEYQ